MPQYLTLFRTIQCCNECRIFFGMGSTETDSSFEDAYEFTDGYGGERVVFSKYFYRDDEGQFEIIQYETYLIFFRHKNVY